MTPLMRGLLAAVLLGVAAFCAFGFLATFEPPGFWGMRVLYGLVGLLCLAVVVQMARRQPPSG